MYEVGSSSTAEVPLFNVGKQVQLLKYNNFNCKIAKAPVGSSTEYLVECRGAKSDLVNAGLDMDDAERTEKDKSQKDAKGKPHVAAWFLIEAVDIQKVYIHAITSNHKF